MERLRNEPDLIDSAVEELLRYCTPVPCGAPRFTLDDVELSGTTVPAGSKVLGMIISANRDTSVFPDPNALDLGRSPNKHLAFAFGPHFCLGSQLARLEGRSALLGLVQRFDEIQLAVDRASLQFKPTPRSAAIATSRFAFGRDAYGQVQYCSRSSRLRSLPVGSRGSSSTKSIDTGHL